MPTITAVLHTENDELRLGRTLETLYPCDEILIVDHGSLDGTVHVARKYGARVVGASRQRFPQQYLESATGWFLCLEPRESVSESLAATLYEWKSSRTPSAPAFSVFLREETEWGWINVPEAQTRLVSPTWKRWQGTMPANHHSALTLEGELLRFAFP